MEGPCPLPARLFPSSLLGGRNEQLPPAPVNLTLGSSPLLFPPEIITDIIHQATLEDPLAGNASARSKALTRYALVARDWHPCAMHVRFSHLVMDWRRDMALGLVEVLDERPELVAMVRSVSVTFRPTAIAKDEIARSDDHFRRGWDAWHDLPGEGEDTEAPAPFQGWCRQYYRNNGDNLIDFQAHFAREYFKERGDNWVYEGEAHALHAFLGLLGTLTNLQHLHLRNSIEHSDLQTRLGAFTPLLHRLRSLACVWSWVTEPSEWLEAWANSLPLIEHLSVSADACREAPSLLSLPRLRHLDVQFLSDVPSSLFISLPYTSLTQLSLSSYGGDYIKENIATLLPPSLEQLDIHWDHGHAANPTLVADLTALLSKSSVPRIRISYPTPSQDIVRRKPELDPLILRRALEDTLEASDGAGTRVVEVFTH